MNPELIQILSEETGHSPEELMALAESNPEEFDALVQQISDADEEQRAADEQLLTLLSAHTGMSVEELTILAQDDPESFQALVEEHLSDTDMEDEEPTDEPGVGAGSVSNNPAGFDQSAHFYSNGFSKFAYTANPYYSQTEGDFNMYNPSFHEYLMQKRAYEVAAYQQYLMEKEAANNLMDDLRRETAYQQQMNQPGLDGRLGRRADLESAFRGTGAYTDAIGQAYDARQQLAAAQAAQAAQATTPAATPAATPAGRSWYKNPWLYGGAAAAAGLGAGAYYLANRNRNNEMERAAAYQQYLMEKEAANNLMDDLRRETAYQQQMNQPGLDGRLGRRADLESAFRGTGAYTDAIGQAYDARQMAGAGAEAAAVADAVERGRLARMWDATKGYAGSAWDATKGYGSHVGQNWGKHLVTGGIGAGLGAAGMGLYNAYANSPEEEAMMQQAAYEQYLMEKEAANNLMDDLRRETAYQQQMNQPGLDGRLGRRADLESAFRGTGAYTDAIGQAYDARQLGGAEAAAVADAVEQGRLARMWDATKGYAGSAWDATKGYGSHVGQNWGKHLVTGAAGAGLGAAGMGLYNAYANSPEEIEQQARLEQLHRLEKTAASYLG